jgi:SSU ribosomal protein S17E
LRWPEYFLYLGTSARKSYTSRRGAYTTALIRTLSAVPRIGTGVKRRVTLHCGRVRFGDVFNPDDERRAMPVRPGYIKKIANLLLERYPEAFTADFEHNKEAVVRVTNVESKDVRNRIAGYVTRRVRVQAAEA